MPVVILHAVMGGSRVHVFPQDGRPEMLVDLREGEILFMRGDCGHRGACYAMENVRVHAYIECSSKRSSKRSRDDRIEQRYTYAF